MGGAAAAFNPGPWAGPSWGPSPSLFRVGFRHLYSVLLTIRQQNSLCFAHPAVSLVGCLCTRQPVQHDSPLWHLLRRAWHCSRQGCRTLGDLQPPVRVVLLFVTTFDIRTSATLQCNTAVPEFAILSCAGSALTAYLSGQISPTSAPSAKRASVRCGVCASEKAGRRSRRHCKYQSATRQA